jgi:hypothetical protein
MWFLGGTEHVDYSRGNQLSKISQEHFIESLAQVWSNIYRSESDALDLFIRFGSIPSAKSDPNAIIRSSLEKSGGWRVAYTKTASDADGGKRQAKQMGSSSVAIEEYDYHVVRS